MQQHDRLRTRALDRRAGTSPRSSRTCCGRGSARSSSRSSRIALGAEVSDRTRRVRVTRDATGMDGAGSRWPPPRSCSGRSSTSRSTSACGSPSRREHRMLVDRLADEPEDIITVAERERLETSAEPPRGTARRVARLQNELATTEEAWPALRALDLGRRPPRRGVPRGAASSALAPNLHDGPHREVRRIHRPAGLRAEDRADARTSRSHASAVLRPAGRYHLQYQQVGAASGSPRPTGVASPSRSARAELRVATRSAGGRHRLETPRSTTLVCSPGSCPAGSHADFLAP